LAGIAVSLSGEIPELNYHMESFTVSTHLTKEEFTKVVLRRLYRQTFAWIVSLVSIGILGYCIYNALNHSVNWADETNYMYWAFGLVFLQLPGIHYFQAKKTYAGNPRANQEVFYTFGEDVIRVRGEDFEGYIPWETLAKVEDVAPWTCLVTMDRALLIFRAQSFSEEQGTYIKRRLLDNSSYHPIP
jgi:hypothetical protein